MGRYAVRIFLCLNNIIGSQRSNNVGNKLGNFVISVSYKNSSENVGVYCILLYKHSASTVTTFSAE